MLSSYRAPRWLPGGNAQTIYAAMLGRWRSHHATPLRRERWQTPDDDFIDVDWLDGPDDAPLVVLFHGLEGGAGSHYARALMERLARHGWRGAVAHFRGCSGEPNRLPRAYHSGDHEEIAWVLARFRARSVTAPLYAAGFSLGGNALLKWLGEAGVAAGEVIDAAAAVSAPLDLMLSGDALGRGFNKVYSRMFLATLKRKGAAKLVTFPGLFDAAAMLRARSLREFDNVVTAPLHGFRNTDDYWTRASSKPGLRAVAVPTLIINAWNDPFVPPAALPDAADVSPAVCLEYPEAGGHCGFASGAFPGRLDWLPRRLLGFFESHRARPGNAHHET
ncbi:MAG: alpha/beta fold hydrolase [Betaproteobacteria bacterium]|nr:alpha/beta fold hydrolase [Betaproteobacteria bacterium]